MRVATKYPHQEGGNRRNNTERRGEQGEHRGQKRTPRKREVGRSCECPDSVHSQVRPCETKHVSTSMGSNPPHPTGAHRNRARQGGGETRIRGAQKHPIGQVQKKRNPQVPTTPGSMQRTWQSPSEANRMKGEGPGGGVKQTSTTSKLRGNQGRGHKRPPR